MAEKKFELYFSTTNYTQTWLHLINPTIVF